MIKATALVLALVLPLGLDTFAVAAALGMAGLEPRRRLRVSIVFSAFEGVMPLVGLFAGSTAARGLGVIADWLAAALLIGLGAYMLLARAGDEKRIAAVSRTRGIGLLGLGLSVSLDELAIGFTFGLVKVPIGLAIALIVVQAFAAAQLGFRAGARLGEGVREGAERLAGSVLLGLGVVLAAAHAIGISL